MRRLRTEPLEDRRVLSAVTVTNNLDLVNGDTSSIANLIADDGGDGIALREAIKAANNTVGADEIDFDFGHEGPETIFLQLGELEITEAVTITGNGADLLTIDAQQNSRVINITATSGDFALAGLTITGGKTTGDGFAYGGGAVQARSRNALLTLADSTITGNYTEGLDVRGGGIYAGTVQVIRSTLSGNSTKGERSPGGGMWASKVTVTDSTIWGNYTTMFGSGGGGIYAQQVTLDNSIVSGNYTIGDFASGGGVRARRETTVNNCRVLGNHTMGTSAPGGGILAGGALTLSRSTISANYTMGERSRGGGIYAPGAFVPYSALVIDSTISGNYTVGRIAYGGGLFAGLDVTLSNSTVSGNYTLGDEAIGGGIVARLGLTLASSTISGNATHGVAADGGGVYVSTSASVMGSIVAGNMAANGSGPDILDHPNSSGVVTASHSLIGDNSDSGLAESVTPDASGNLIGGPMYGPLDPLLGPLADNGGPTMTHALLPGSPAIDAGDPGFVAPPYLDQRGYYRVVDGDGDMMARVDMGAVEYASVAAKPGDGNLDGVVDGLDYILWAMHFGDDPAGDPPGAPLNGDFNDDGKVDGLDYIVWAENFELNPPPVVLTAREASVSTASDVSAVDTVIEREYATEQVLADNATVNDWLLSRAFDLVFAKKHARGKF